MLNNQYIWQRFPETSDYLDKCLFDLKENNAFLYKLETRLQAHAGARLIDWVDFFVLPPSEAEPLEKLNYTYLSKTADYSLLHVADSLLPKVIVGNYNGVTHGVAIKVERIADFQAANSCPAPVDGDPFTGFRRSLVNKENNTGVFVVERRIADCTEPGDCTEKGRADYMLAWEIWMSRPRRTVGDETPEQMEALIQETYNRAHRVVELVGQPMAGDVAMNAERVYWQARNELGRDIKHILDQLGLGWANHDHHTFRCSRDYFGAVIRTMQILGFFCREKFYAGKEAGWGAQVMEHPAGFALFVDVDLNPEEVDIDFPNEPLPKIDRLGTVGMWCKLHGESLFDAGLHHIAGLFDFELITKKLVEADRTPMKPFSEFSYLKQFFSKGQFWPISSVRLDELVSAGRIAKDKAQRFVSTGGLGSHIEIIERNEGFKGFNQQNVSDIISRTDPRENI